jgi:hypothetical protein
LSRQRQRRAVTEVLGLDECQRLQVTRVCDGLPGGIDRIGQCVRRQVDGLIAHAATLSLLTRLFGLLASSRADLRATRVECRS